MAIVKDYDAIIEAIEGKIEKERGIEIFRRKLWNESEVQK